LKVQDALSIQLWDCGQTFGNIASHHFGQGTSKLQFGTHKTTFHIAMVVAYFALFFVNFGILMVCIDRGGAKIYKAQ
jgi:hypothetical protein